MSSGIDRRLTWIPVATDLSLKIANSWGFKLKACCAYSTIILLLYPVNACGTLATLNFIFASIGRIGKLWPVVLSITSRDDLHYTIQVPLSTVRH